MGGELIIKDIEFKRGCSLAAIGGYILYNIINMMIDYDRIAITYPENNNEEGDDNWTNHILYFINITIAIYLWTLLYMLLSFIILFIFKLLILNIIKFDSSIFKKMGDITKSGNASDILFGLSDEYAVKSKNEITIKDLWDMMFSFISYKKGLLFIAKLLVVSILVSIIFASVVAPPTKMKQKKNRNTNLRLFLITQFVVTIFMFVIFLIVNNLLSI
jgi:hypothetical protein